jgi:AraC-like DNA-binding protein
MNTNPSINKYRRSCDESSYTIQSIESYCHQWVEDSRSVLQLSYLIIWIIEGSGDIYVDLDKAVIDVNIIYFVKPGQSVLVKPGGHTRGWVISFSLEFYAMQEKDSSGWSNLPFNGFSSLPGIALDPGVNRVMMDLTDKMSDEYEHNLLLRPDILRSYLKLVILYLRRLINDVQQKNSISGKTVLANRFYQLVERDFMTKKRVKQYADELAVTSNYLNCIIKEISGLSARYHIQRRVVLEAKRRAIFEGVSLKEVAYYLGFDDCAHFSKYFKNHSGKNFTEFKRSSYFTRA